MPDTFEDNDFLQPFQPDAVPFVDDRISKTDIDTTYNADTTDASEEDENLFLESFSPSTTVLEPTPTPEQEPVVEKQYYLDNQRGAIDLLKRSFMEYNTIGSMIANTRAREIVGTTKVEADAIDPSYDPTNYKELWEDLPREYQKEIFQANSYIDALWKRERILQSLENTEAIQEYGLLSQIGMGIITGTIDPAAIVGGGAIGSVGKHIGSTGTVIARASSKLRQSGRSGRIAHAAGTGVFIGGGSAATQFGFMSQYDPSVNAETVLAETIGGAVGGFALPIGFGGIGAAYGSGVGQAARRQVSEGTRWLANKAGEGAIGVFSKSSIANVIAGRTRFDVVQTKGNLAGTNADHINLGNKLFEDPVGTGGRDARQTTADIVKTKEALRLHTEMAYNHAIQKLINTRQRFGITRNIKKWTDSEIRQQLDSAIYHRLLERQHFDRAGTGGDNIEPDIKEAADHFFTILTDINRTMVETKVAGATEGNAVPLRLSNTKIHNIVEERFIASHGDNPNLSIAEAAEVRGRYLKEIEDELAVHIREGIMADTPIHKQIIGILGDARKKRDIEERTRIESEEAAIIKAQREAGMDQEHIALSQHIRARQRMEETSVSNIFDTDVYLDAAMETNLLNTLADTVAHTHITGAMTRRGRVEELEPTTALSDLIKRLGLDENISPDTRQLLEDLLIPQGRMLGLESMQLSNPSNLDYLLNIADTDLAKLLASHIEESTGQYSLAAFDIKSAGQFKAMTDALKLDAANSGEAYPVNFWEDTYSAFLGRPTKGQSAEGMQPWLRRIRNGTGLGQLGMAGWSMVSDSANVMARGFSGMKGMVQAIPEATRRMFTHGGQSNNEVLAQLETMTGDLISSHQFQRGDVHLDVLSVREAESLSRSAKASVNAARKIDHIQAYSNRVMGAMSGMNTVNSYIAIAAQKTILHEIGRYMRAADAGQTLKPKHMKYLTDMGFDQARLEMLREDWNANVEYGPMKGIKKLNADGFSGNSEAILANGITRGVKQMMGEAMIGELPHRLTTPAFQVLLHLRQSVMVAHEKGMRRGMELGAGHMATHIAAGMAIGLTAQFGRTVVQKWTEDPTDPMKAVDAATELMTEDGAGADFWTPGVRRAVSNISPLSGITDSSSTVLAPLVSFFDTDTANAFHMGYNRYNYGEARKGLDTILTQVPSAGFAEDAITGLWGGGKLIATGITEQKVDSEGWDNFIEGIFGVAPMGNTVPGLLLMNQMIDQDDETSGFNY